MNVIQQLMKYDELYAIGKPIISDREYDLFKIEARNQFPRHPYFNIVGAPVKGVKTKLPVVMGSLNKVKRDGSYQSWCDDNKGSKVYWAKMDGVSLYRKYDNGKLIQAITRGNGEYGQDITQKAMIFCDDEIRMKKPFTGEVRSEIMLMGDIYTSLGYTTRRNGAAGLINQDTIDNVENLVVRTYELISDSEGVPTTEIERIKRMVELGFELAPYTFYDDDLSDSGISELLAMFKGTSGFDIDGVVVVLNDSEREDVYKPSMKVAFKENEEAIPCEVTRVEWQMGRTGRLTPVVNIVPTVIGGVLVEKATGFNAKFIQDNKIEKGVIVNIYRANEVIPYIDSVETI